ncbi:MAG TPA: NADH-quinone oxidoreductase subunit NuoK [Gammaproteobacteria bacterium]|jgi:NADH-quinone oxidoreductase subunit K|nr:NADH-quinone oxidoreductase subunit NuoK [Gammaproteobacteria bacterium]
MVAIVPSYGIWLAGILFAIGMAGLLVRRNIVFMLMCIEIMLNAAGLVFIVGGARWGQADGQVLFLLILALAAAEVAIGLALILLFHRRYQTLDADAASRMRG